MPRAKLSEVGPSEVGPSEVGQSEAGPSGEGRSGAKLRVAVLCGGRSAEHEISLLSARFVVQSLDRERFEPVLIGIDKAGRWRPLDEAALLGAPADPRRIALDTSAPERPIPAWPAEAPAGLGVDVVFPVLHGPMGEDGTVQGLLALAGLPHVGSGVLGSAVGMDKDVMKRLLAAEGIPIVQHRTIRRFEWEREGDLLLVDLANGIGFPAFVKPANLGSSVGVSKVRSEDELGPAIEEAFRWDTKIVVERGVPGVRELEVAILGNDDPIASRVGEIVVTHRDGFYSYDAKYVDAEGSEPRIPADLPRELEERIRELAVQAFLALEGEGLARVDLFLAPGGEIYVNEINTMPGFTAISMVPKLWEASGLPPKELVGRLIELAVERAERRRSLRTSV